MITKLYNKLNSKDFQSPGGISHNFYIVPYDVREEGKTLADVAHIVDDLKRPNDFIDVLSLDLFEVFMEYLGTVKSGGQSLLEDQLETDGQAEEDYIHAGVADNLRAEAHGREFLDFVYSKVVAHFGKDEPSLKRPYVLFHGVGAMYPYLRANEFLTAYEAVNDASRYKVILFYPGIIRDGQFSLFGILNDQHAYRAQLLEI